MRENFKFKDSDGIELNVYKWIPKDEKMEYYKYIIE